MITCRKRTPALLVYLFPSTCYLLSIAWFSSSIIRFPQKLPASLVFGPILLSLTCFALLVGIKHRCRVSVSVNRHLRIAKAVFVTCVIAAIIDDLALRWLLDGRGTPHIVELPNSLQRFTLNEHGVFTDIGRAEYFTLFLLQNLLVVWGEFLIVTCGLYIYLTTQQKIVSTHGTVAKSDEATNAFPKQ